MLTFTFSVPKVECNKQMNGKFKLTVWNSHYQLLEIVYKNRKREELAANPPLYTLLPLIY